MRVDSDIWKARFVPVWADILVPHYDITTIHGDKYRIDGDYGYAMLVPTGDGGFLVVDGRILP